MAATCQERGITHVKDVFSKVNSPTSPGEKEVAGSFFFGFSTGTKQRNDMPVSASSGTGAAGGKSAARPAGGFLMRNGRNKDVDIMEIPVPPPRKKNPNNSESSAEDPTSPQLANSKDIYLSPKSVQNARRTSSERSDVRKDITVAVVHAPPANTLPSPRSSTAPTSPKRAAPPPPTSPSWPSPPPPITPPTTQVPSPPTLTPPPPPLSSPTNQAPSPPSQFQSPTRVAPPPPGIGRTFSTVVPSPLPPDLPPPPPPPPSMTIESAYHPQKHTNPRHSGSIPGPDSPSKSRYSLNSHTLHIDTSSPIQHSHRRGGSGDYSTGSLFSGDNDIINHSPPVFTETNLVTMGNKPQSPSKGTDIMDYSKKTQPGFSKHVDNESSLLTNSEHGAASSGYFSELSTDSEKLPPSPLVNGVKGHRSQGSESSSCEEEGFTLNFEEDRNADTSSTKIYHEYDGEDFGKYLQEDDLYPPSTTTLTRRVQRRKQQHVSPQTQTLPPPNRQTHKKPGLKDKLSHAFTLTKSDKKQPRYHSPQQSKTSIHQMSFMNSKMGMYASEEELRDYTARDLETKSDLGGVRKSSASELPSWHKDTLSMSTLRRAKRELDQRKAFSSSTPNLADPGYFQPSPPASPKYGESYSDFGADIKKKKKVNRFKFWKVFGKKKKESSQVIENQQNCVDIRL